MSELSQEKIQNFHKQIALNVAKIRKEKGLSQLELSLEIGLKSCSLVAGAEANYKNIHFNLEHLYKISKVLNVKMSEFFENLE